MAVSQVVISRRDGLLSCRATSTADTSPWIRLARPSKAILGISKTGAGAASARMLWEPAVGWAGAHVGGVDSDEVLALPAASGDRHRAKVMTLPPGWWHIRFSEIDTLAGTMGAWLRVPRWAIQDHR